MSYREKFAWLCLVAMLIAYTPYFVHAHLNPPPEGTLPDLSHMARFGLTAAAHAIMVLIGLAYLRFAARGEGPLKPDERDRAIDRRSMQVGYWLLMIGLVVVGVISPFTESGWTLVNGALFFLVLSETARSLVAVWSYRRGWHG